MGAFLLKSRENPMKVVGMVIGIIVLMIGVTVSISTVLFLRNTRSNRILPARRIIRRRPREKSQTWTFRTPFLGGSSRAAKFHDCDLEGSPDRDDGSSRRPWPAPPSAPSLPPPPRSDSGLSERPSERSCAVPTVSGAVENLCSRKSIRSKQGSVSSALVSELKMRLEQKIIEANRGYC